MRCRLLSPLTGLIEIFAIHPTAHAMGESLLPLPGLKISAMVDHLLLRLNFSTN